MIIHCSGCDRKVAYGPIQPTECSYCGVPLPVRPVVYDQPEKPYALSVQDRRFLKQLRIAADA